MIFCPNMQDKLYLRWKDGRRANTITIENNLRNLGIKNTVDFAESVSQGNERFLACAGVSR